MEIKKFLQEELRLEVQVPLAILGKIEYFSRKYYPNEYGGILVGSYESNGIIACVDDIIEPRARSLSRFSFTRYASDVQGKLSKYERRWKGEKYYLGEWHSHPDCPATPSSTDLAAMHLIGGNRTLTRIDLPLLLIASIYPSHSKFEPKLYGYYEEQLYFFDA